MRLLVCVAATAAAACAPYLHAERTNPDGSTGADGKWILWSNKPAARWLDAFPIGNGNLGGMIFGGVARDQIALNEVTFWSGDDYHGPTDRGAEALPRIRELLTERMLTKEERLATLRTAIVGRSLPALRQLKEAAEVVQAEMNLFPEAKKHIGTRLPVGDLLIDSTHAPKEFTNYRRSLDIERSVADVRYEAGGVSFHREYFASNPDHVLVVRLKSDKPGNISFRASAKQWQPQEEPVVRSVGTDELVLEARALERKHSDGTTGVRLQAHLKVQAEGGSVRTDGDGLLVEHADAATVLLTMATDFRGADRDAEAKTRIEAAARKSYPELLAAHIADVQPRFNRVSLDLGSTPSALPTAERLANFKMDGQDNAFAALLFQFGRYLVLAGSRENSRLPLPLQGLWADGKAATMGWSDDYHQDVNTEQNYWPAEVGNLSESVTPLFDYIEQLRIHGRESAKLTYGAGGWCAHITANAWGSSPFNHGGSPTSGTWLATHLWEHYAFGGDKDFLARIAYPVLKENAQFYLDSMTVDPKSGWLVTCPAYSPENHFQDPLTGENRNITMGNTADTEIVGELFRECTEAGAVLGIDAEFRRQLAEAAGKLPPLKKLIHPDGRLMEWLDTDYDGVYARSHRHSSHLLGLHPFESISPGLDPVVSDAAHTTLKRKLQDMTREDTEWTRGNFIHYFARLLDGDAAYEQFRMLVKKWIPGTSGLSVSWNEIFCLDGNTSAASGLAEMLLQSQRGEIALLPALPAAWPEGSVSGLRARGGFEVAMNWKSGTLTGATILSLAGAPCRLRTAKPVSVTIDGKPVEKRISTDPRVVEFPTAAGKTYVVSP